jgi:hypothetical protein
MSVLIMMAKAVDCSLVHNDAHHRRGVIHNGHW